MNALCSKYIPHNHFRNRAALGKADRRHEERVKTIQKGRHRELESAIGSPPVQSLRKRRKERLKENSAVLKPQIVQETKTPKRTTNEDTVSRRAVVTPVPVATATATNAPIITAPPAVTQDTEEDDEATVAEDCSDLEQPAPTTQHLEQTARPVVPVAHHKTNFAEISARCADSVFLGEIFEPLFSDNELLEQEEHVNIMGGNTNEEGTTDKKKRVVTPEAREKYLTDKIKELKKDLKGEKEGSQEKDTRLEQQGRELNKISIENEQLKKALDGSTTEDFASIIKTLSSDNGILKSDVAVMLDANAKMKASEDKLIAKNKELQAKLDAGVGKNPGQLLKEAKAWEDKYNRANRRADRLEAQIKQLSGGKTSGDAQGDGNTNQGQPAANSELDALKKELQEAKRDIRILQHDKKELTGNLELCIKELKKHGQTAAVVEMSKAGRKKVTDCVKILYREWKFVLGADQTTKFTTAIYDAIKDDKELGWSNKDDTDTHMDLEDFQRVYTKHALSSLNQRRQYTQTKCLNAAISKFVHVALNFVHFALNMPF